jgi:putative dehydrogenase
MNSAKPDLDCVGVIGLGTMGGAMAANLLEKGFPVVGFDVNPQAAEKLQSQDGQALDSPASVAGSAHIIITSLPSAKALADTAGELARSPTERKRIVIETSTLALGDKQAAQGVLTESSIELLDCPLSGTGAQAAVRDLVVFGSGDEQSFLHCQAVFDGIARAQYYLGEFGNGSRMKFIANLLVAIHNVAAAEAMVLGMKAGLDGELIYKVIADSAGTSRMFEVRGPMMVANDYDNATMKMDLWQKDIGIIGDFVQDSGVKTPLFDASLALYNQGLAEGRGQQDTASVCAVLEKMASIVR